MTALQSTVVHARDSVDAATFAPFVGGAVYAFHSAGTPPSAPPGELGSLGPGDLPAANEWQKEKLRSGKALAIIAAESLVHLFEVEECAHFTGFFIMYLPPPHQPPGSHVSLFQITGRNSGHMCTCV